MSLPSDYAARKAFPILTVLLAYFPDAIEGLVELCVQGNIQHAVDPNAENPFKLPEDTITWDRSKSTDQGNTAMRHLWDHNRAKRGTGSVVDSDGILHILKVFWRAGAEAQLTIERLRAEKAAADAVVNAASVPGATLRDVADVAHQHGKRVAVRLVPTGTTLDGGPGRPRVHGAKPRKAKKKSRRR